MIRIVRPPAPSGYGERAERARRSLEEVAEAGGYKAQRRFDFDLRLVQQARDPLAAAGFGKCAYCESRIGPEVTAEIDTFRPRQHAEGLGKGETHPDHYWWLAYEWDNLVCGCTACCRAKRNRFPVRGVRAGPGDPLDREDPLLVDPYGPGEPSDHLVFVEDGTVRANDEYGEVTIEVLALNRPALIDARRAAAERLLEALPFLPHDERERLRAPEIEFAALHRQLLDRHVMVGSAAEIADLPPTAPEALAVWIDEVELVNFGCFRQLELHFGEPGASREPWIVVIGSNGVGKSTVLKAIALALTSEEHRRRLAPDASRFVNREAQSRRGWVRVRFNNGDEVRLEARRGEPLFEVTGRRPEFSLVGYGSTRLLHRETMPEVPQATGPRLTNLFDPWAPLADAEQWLADPALVDAAYFKMFATSLKTLLSIEDDVELKRSGGEIRARMFDVYHRLYELSDGYQSILAFALDLGLALGNEHQQGFSTENFEGMVLIDEIEVHLHPEWKQRVVGDLRAMFPHLQFVVTTHDPLCLRGLEHGEIHLLQRDDEVGIRVEQIDIPPGLDADEILTGRWFGLDSTLDGQVEGYLLAYRRMRMDGVAPDAPAMVELQQRLESTLGSYAGTSLGRVMVEAASEFVAEQAASSATSGGAAQLTKEEIKQRLLEHARQQQ